MAALRLRVLTATFVATVAGCVAVASASSSPGSPPMVVVASYAPAHVEFGDTVTATVTVLLDRNAVRPSSLALTDDLAPLTQLSPPRTTRSDSGRLEAVSVRVTVACLADACAAEPGITAVALPRVRATVVTSNGGIDTVTAGWPPLQVRSRVVASDLAAARPPFAADSSPNAPTFRVSPATLAFALDVIAAVCAAGAVALLVRQIVILRRRHRREPGEMERALQLVREAERRPAPDRRRALSLLARLLRARGAELGQTVDDVAWSEPTPDSDRLRELVDRIEGRDA